MTTPTHTIPAYRPVAARWPAACGSSNDPGTQWTSTASPGRRALRNTWSAPFTRRCVMRSLKRAATIANRRERPNGRARRTLGARPAISVRERRKEMPELVALRAQVLPVGVVGRDLDRHALGDVQAVALQPDDLLRSEEHTSELQSLAYLVCRLLLEKKK